MIMTEKVLSSYLINTIKNQAVIKMRFCIDSLINLIAFTKKYKFLRFLYCNQIRSMILLMLSDW